MVVQVCQPVSAYTKEKEPELSDYLRYKNVTPGKIRSVKVSPSIDYKSSKSDIWSEFYMTGNPSISADELLSYFKELKSKPPDEIGLANCIDQIRARYIAQGYNLARVCRIIDWGGGKLELQVDEGIASKYEVSGDPVHEAELEEMLSTLAQKPFNKGESEEIVRSFIRKYCRYQDVYALPSKNRQDFKTYIITIKLVPKREVIIEQKKEELGPTQKGAMSRAESILNYNLMK